MSFQKWHLVLLLLALSPTLTQASEQRLKKSLKEHNYENVAKYLKKSPVGMSKLKKLGKRYRSSPLVRAVNATNKMTHIAKDLKLSSKKFVQSAFFCETSPITYGMKESRFFDKRKTGLPHSIEYDATTHNHFVLLDGKKAILGKGKRKVVKKAILYDHIRPKVLARAEEQEDDKTELLITKALQGKIGLFKTHALCRMKHDKKIYNSYYSTIYRSGSLQSVFKRGDPLSPFEKLQIASQLLQGLHSMHANKIVHCDLGARNYLVNIPEGAPGRRAVRACIADFGRAKFIKGIKTLRRVQGNTSYTAPEGLHPKRLHPTDYYHTDVFALGCVFYHLFYGQKAPWQDISYVKDTSRPLHVRYDELVSLLKQHTEARREALAAKADATGLSSEEKFEQLLLSMLHLDPKKRGQSAELSEKMKNIYQQAKLSM